ncbi:MAG TPA: ABC-2 family transporter protein [Gemmatimonadaceae bacterium]|nr:ABC-2 family transporter protein [Gemmatimonadaceae bacterium]
MTTDEWKDRVRRELAKYGAFARVGFAEARAEPGELYARVAFLVVILGVFSALWRAVGASGSGAGERATMVWYLAMTEWVLMSAPNLHFDIEAEVRRGDVAYQIARPVSYLGAHVARGLGALGVRAPVLLATACAAGAVFGGAPARPMMVARVIAIGGGASLGMSVWYASIGLLAFWLGDVAPVYWIWQKFTFVLGGLLLPLSFYPNLVIRLAMVTPFPPLLTGPASFVLARPLYGVAELLGLMLFWSMAACAVAGLLFRHATRTLQVNGG